MKNRAIQFLRHALIGGMVTLALAAHSAHAAVSERAVQLIVPFPAGGATDFIARALAEQLSKKLATAFIVENRPGAASIIGTEFVARAPADGYTLLLATSSSMVTNRFLFKKLRYDPDAFEPISLLCVTPLVLVSNLDLPSTNVPQLIDYSKEHPGTISYASFGTGTQSHLALAKLSRDAGVDMEHVPYKGATEALPAVIGGHVQLYVDTIISSLPYIQSHKVRALGVTTAKRTAILPDVPTIAEQGYPGFDLAPWYGLVAPPGTPAPIVEKLRKAMTEVMSAPEFRNQLAQAGAEIPEGDTGPEGFRLRVKADISSTQALLAAAGVTAQ
jgi:tripartite-type tricarboxylate transporter receptor subunit TctC